MMQYFQLLISCIISYVSQKVNNFWHSQQLRRLENNTTYIL